MINQIILAEIEKITGQSNNQEYADMTGYLQKFFIDKLTEDY